LFLVWATTAFVAPPSAGARRQVSPPTVVSAGGKEGSASAAAAKPEYEQYDWQRVAEAKGAAPAAQQKQMEIEIPEGLDSVPDVPYFDEDDDFVEEGESGDAAVLKTKVREREILPDLPGDPDLLPPEPNPMFEVGFGLFEWTGIWIGILVVLGGLGYVFSIVVARVEMDQAFADTALTVTKTFCGLFQILFLARIVLTQFPKIKTTDMPWAVVHYPTEWVLSPTRAVFKPEAGVDIAPVIWLAVILLTNELLTGPSGVFQLARESPGGAMKIR